MTGFGSATYADDKYQIKVEIRALNSKFLDLSYKIPKEFAERELDIKNFLTNELKRGKINLSLEYSIENGAVLSQEVNDKLFEAYYKTFETLADSVHADKGELFRLAIQSPDVLKAKEADETLPDWDIFMSVLAEAVKKCKEFRTQEGAALSEKLHSYADKIGEGLQNVIEQDPERIKNIKERIEGNLEEMVGMDKVDKNRFEQELIYFIERLDITEEKDRLSNHLKYFKEAIRKSRI